MARVPRIQSRDVTAIVDALSAELEEFIEYCNEHGIEGTILIERKVIEFHWTFGCELEAEKWKAENSKTLEGRFRKLTEHFESVRDRVVA